MDIQYLMKQARKLEKAMADAKEKLGEIAVEAESGGGLVKVAMAKHYCGTSWRTLSIPRGKSDEFNRKPERYAPDA